MTGARPPRALAHPKRLLGEIARDLPPLSQAARQVDDDGEITMQFGKRNIRSAGRKSGSVEITLPVDLAVLEGVPCDLTLRDGLVPEITLQPDLRGVVSVFEALWEHLGLGLENVGAIGDFCEADYALGLFPTAKWGMRPSLAYADALVIRRGLERTADIETQAIESFARLVESMAAIAGRRLGLSDELACLFGNQIADVLSGGAIDTRDAFVRGLASQAMGEPRSGDRASPLGAECWRDAQHELTQLYDQFASWSGETLTKAREHWYRARRFEARVGARG